MNPDSIAQRVARGLLLACVLAATAAAPAAAQQDGADATRMARQREALRRSQDALKQAQEQQAALTAEQARDKAQWDADKARLAADARARSAQLGNAQAEATRLRAEVARLTAELDTWRTAAAAEKLAAQESQEKLAARLAVAERLLNERTQTVASVTALTERATQALAAAEKANAEMHALGLKMIDELRGSGNGLSVGFRQVRLENQAEALRDRLDALKLPAAK